MAMNANCRKSRLLSSHEPELPRFFTNNNSHYMFESIEIPNNQSYSKRECLILPPNRIATGQAAFESAISLVLTKPEKSEAKIANHDIDGSLGEQRIKARYGSNRKQKERQHCSLGKSKILSSRASQRAQSDNINSELYAFVNEKQLTARKLIQNTRSSIAKDKQRLRQAIRSDRQRLMNVKQITPELNYINGKILHQRTNITKCKNLHEAWPQHSIAKMQESYLMERRSAVQSGLYEVRPWTNNFQDQI